MILRQNNFKSSVANFVVFPVDKKLIAYLLKLYRLCARSETYLPSTSKENSALFNEEVFILNSFRTHVRNVVVDSITCVIPRSKGLAQENMVSTRGFITIFCNYKNTKSNFEGPL